MGQLEGKLALVLGAAGAGNMGQTIAAMFQSEGAKAVVAGRNEKELKKFSQKYNGKYLLCDITHKSEVDKMVESVLATYGRLDVAVNATGW